jgi:hypothetical protein
MAKCNAQFLQIGLGYIRQDIEIDGTLGKHGRVLREPEPIKPSCDLIIDAQSRMLARSLFAGRTSTLMGSSAGALYYHALPIGGVSQ